MSQLTVTRPRPAGSLTATTGFAEIKMLDTYLPPYDVAPAAGVACHVAAAFTPTGPSMAVDPTGEDAMSITNATVRQFISINGANIGSAYHFRAGARRKPGTTGAIAAQVVTFTVNTIELCRFTVAAADANTDPICGSCEMVSPTPDTRYGLAGRNMTIGVTAADADIEIFFEMSGDD